MTIINPNSISGISSITALNSTAAINLFKADGTSANIIAGVTTGSNFITGTSNVHSTGYECTNINASGIITATSMDMISTDAGSSAAPEFKLYRNSASPADADYLGQIKFAGESDTGVERNYAKITGKILDASNGTEDGIIEFAHIKAGSQTITGRWRSDSLQLLNGTALTVAGSTTVTGNIIPSSDSATDIGTNSVRFANLYADTLYGDGSNLTGISGVTINSNADNRIITGSGTAATLNAESTLNYGSNQLTFSGSATPLSGTSHNYSVNIYRDGGSGYGYFDTITSGSYTTGVRIRTYNNTTYNNVIEHTTSKVTNFQTNGSTRLTIDSVGQVLPGADDAQNLGSSTKRWANIYAADMHYSNEGGKNSVDGTWGSYTIQEGESDLYLLNNRNGKKYKFVLQEVS